MKLTYYTEQTLPRLSGRQGGAKVARLSLSRFGIISFNKIACELMGLKPGDKISLAQDSEDPQNFYFFKDPQHGFALYGSSKDGYSRFAHKAFVTLITETLELPPDKNIKALIGGQPTVLKNDKVQTRYWGILIRPSV